MTQNRSQTETPRNRTKLIATIAGGLLGSAALAWSGESAKATTLAPEAEAQDESWDWAYAYKNMGKLYSNEDAAFLQSFSLLGRFHYSYGYTDGSDTSGSPFTYDTTEIRRMRVGAKAQLLNYFDLKGQAEIFDDQHPRGGDRGFEFTRMWDLYGRFDAGSAFDIEGLDTFKVGYGRRETHTSSEWDISSNKLKTVERSAISNKIWPSDEIFSNPTGAWVQLGNGNWDLETGVFSTTTDEVLAPWDDGEMFWANATYDFKEKTGADISNVWLAGFYQNADLDQERLAGGVEWATSATLNYGRDRWQFQLEGIYGQNGAQSSAAREGNFWGVVFVPSYWLTEDRLELVGRYQYQGSEAAEGIRLNSRYVRRAGAVDPGTGLSNGRGDEHHSVYLGLKYHIIKDNMHVLAGVEYDDIDRQGADVYDGWTTFLGFRTFF